MNLNLDEYFEQQKDFSGNVLIAKNKKIIVQASYGYANKRKRILNTSQTKFMVGSITKPMTALCILQLVEKGKLSIQQNIEAYFPDFYKGEKITIYHLLTQTSGIQNYITLRNEINFEKNYTIQEILEIVNNHKLKFPAGKKWLYSNTNYLILARIIELVSGMSYHNYVKHNIFMPAKMEHSDFIVDEYKQGDNSFHPSLYYGCGDLVSTTEDLFLLEQAVCNGTLLKEQLVKEMQEPHHNGRYVKYGYGLFIKNHFGGKSICHSGSLPYGYTSHFEKYLRDDITIFVLSNAFAKYGILSLKGAGATYISREIASYLYQKRLGALQKIF